MDGIKRAGGISFGVSMATGQLAKDTKAARTMIGGFVTSTQKHLEGLRTSLLGIGGALTAAFSTQAIASGIKTSMERIDSLNQSAKTLGITTESLSRLGFVAAQSESSQESLIRGLGRVAKATDDARRGIAETADLYKALGLNAKSLAQLAPDKQFQEIGTAIGKLRNESAQLVATQRIFGRSSADLVNVFKLGKTEIDKLTVSADQLGVTIKGVDAEQVALANDAIDRMKSSLGGAFNQLAINIAPTVTKIADEFARAAAYAARLPGGQGGDGGFWSQAWQFGGDVFRGARHITTGAIGDVSDDLAAIAKLFGYRSETWDTFNRNMAHQFQGTRKSFVEGFIGRPSSPTGGIGRPSPMPALVAPQQAAAFDFMRQAGEQFATRALHYIQTPQQVVQGLIDGAVPNMQRQLFGANIMSGLGGGEGSARKFTSVAPFSAVESGSLAAYQQRVRGQQQFDKIEVKQLDVLKSIDKKLDRPPVEMVAEGSV